MSANTPSAPSPGSPDHHAALLRKTPRQARADQTLRTIYEATAQILQAQGLAGLSTNSVAELAGYTGYPLSSTEAAGPVTWKRARRGGSVSPSNAAPCVGIQKRASHESWPLWALLIPLLWS